MNAPSTNLSAVVLSPFDLARASVNFWANHCGRLASLRQFSLAQGQGQLCINLQAPHDLAAHRLQLARAELQRIKEQSP